MAAKRRCGDDADRTRVLRGLMIEMAPAQDTLSLVLSPEGHLTPSALFGLRSDEAIDAATSKQLHEQLETILTMIHELTAQAWNEAEFS